MEQEEIFSGYCRSLDASRMVTVVKEQGRLTEVDCDFETCLYAGHCPVGKRIREFLGE